MVLTAKGTRRCGCRFWTVGRIRYLVTCSRGSGCPAAIKIIEVARITSHEIMWREP